MAARYITDRFMPDKAIDLIDEASSRVRMYRSAAPPSLKEALAGLQSLNRELDAAVSNQEFELAAELRDRERKLRDRIDSQEQELRDANSSDEIYVTEEDIAGVVSMWTGIPVVRIAGEESERLLKMEETLHNRIIGQDEAITTLAKAVRRARAGIKNPKRPIGSFIFLGPTGVGKTELAKALAEFMFGSEEHLIKIDMSEFMERHAVSRLVGAPPGYVGYEEGGQLTEAVRRKSYSVILLDEIEKAHPEAFNMLLQIMEDGNLADAKGRKVDFRNTIIIMTSNVGAEQISRDMNLGFTMKEDEEKTKAREYDQMREKVTSATEADVPAGVPQPHRRDDRLPLADEGRDPADRRAGAGAREQAAPGAGDRAGSDRGGDGPARRARLRPHLRRSPAAADHPEPDRRSAGGRCARFAVPGGVDRSRRRRGRSAQARTGDDGEERRVGGGFVAP